MTFHSIYTSVVQVLDWIRNQLDGLCRSLVPETDDTYDLGSATKKFSIGYFKRVKATTESVELRRDTADYGGGFSTYTPPTGAEGLIVIAEDTNAVTPGRRIYVYSGAAWRYVALS